MRVGVLGLQGDVPEHLRALAEARAGVEAVIVRDAGTLRGVDALCLPGGESTTMARHLAATGLAPLLTSRIREGLPVLATCAGLILLAREIEETGVRNPEPLGILDVRVRRNDYGSQRESFEAPLRVEGLPPPPFPGVFIRAPRILAVGPSARPFVYAGEEVVGVREGSVWGLTFHPELSRDRRLHRLFLASVGEEGQSRKSTTRASARAAAPRRTRTR